MSDLFLDDLITLEKLAMATKVSDQADSWQRDVAAEIYKQVPYIGDYAVNVILDRVDAERGFASGYAEVKPKSMSSELAQQSLPEVKIPIIIKDRMLAPFDVFLDGKQVWPLSEARLQEHLFRTDTLETTNRKPDDRGIADQLYPPMRTNYGNSMMSMGEGTMGKFAAALGVEKTAMPEPNRVTRFAARSAGKRFIELLKGGKKMNIDGVGELRPGNHLSAYLGTAAERKPRFFGLLGHKRDLNSPRSEALTSLVTRGVTGATAVGAGVGAKKIYHKAKKTTKELTNHMSKHASLLEAIAPTIDPNHADALFREVAGDHQIKVAASANPEFKEMLLLASAGSNEPFEKRAEAVYKNARPTIVQLQKLASGNWLLKWANANNFSPQQEEVSPSTAASVAGSDKIQEMSPNATITVSSEKAQKASLDEPKYELAKQFGTYEAQTEETNEPVVGTVLPVIDFEMQPLDLYVFTNGQMFSVQDEIAGKKLMDTQAELPFSDQIHGDGVFVHQGEQGFSCLLPVTVQNTSQGPDGSTSYECMSVFGESVSLVVAPGLQTIEQLGEGQFAIPDSLKWLPLAGQPVHLVESPLDMEELSTFKQAPGAVDVRATGKGEFSMEGAPVEKVASDLRTFIKKADAEFLLVGMGMDPLQARDTLSNAEKAGLVKVAGLNPLIPSDSSFIKEALAELESLCAPLRRSLVKEAAALADSETADKILSLGFLNPENIGIFAEYLPEMDETVSKLAELLIATRLGLSQIDEGAVERAMKNLEEVIEGLKMLQQKQMI